MTKHRGGRPPRTVAWGRGVRDEVAGLPSSRLSNVSARVESSRGRAEPAKR